jgi:hypothetical protein
MSYDRITFKIISIIVVLICLYLFFGCKSKQVQCEAYSAIDNSNWVQIDSTASNYE